MMARSMDSGPIHVVTDALVRLLPGALLLAACGEAPLAADPGPPDALTGPCSVPSNEIFSGGPGKDGIPALTDPAMVFAWEQGAQYLSNQSRVIGVEIEGQAVAIPHNIGWWHEIVNLNVGARRLAVTYCPLTGSSIAFDRSSVGGAEFGVSGLLYRNNLIMYDRRTEESLWLQMVRQGVCGPSKGADLALYPVIEMTWEGWHTLHPDTKVVSVTDFTFRDYNRYPYGDYEQLNNRSTLFPMPFMDSRRPFKERVLGIARLKGGIAFPFGLLESQGQVVIADAGFNQVVFWNSDRQAAAAYYAKLGEKPVQFTVENRQIVDVETRSIWNIAGVAEKGPRAGQRLQPVAEAYVSFWFAWASFQPETTIWSAAQ